MHDANKKLVARVRAGATRLARVEVTDSKSFTKFVERLSRWNNSDARMVGEIIGEPGWSDAVESSLRKVAKASMEGAEARRAADRQWEIERLDARLRAERSRDVDETTKQYQAELRMTLANQR